MSFFEIAGEVFTIIAILWAVMGTFFLLSPLVFKKVERSTKEMMVIYGLIFLTPAAAILTIGL